MSDRLNGILDYLLNTDNMSSFGSHDPVAEQLVVDYNQPNMVDPMATFEASRDFTMTDPGVVLGGHRMDDPNVIHDPKAEVAPTPAGRQRKPLIDAQTMKRVLSGEISLTDATLPSRQLLKTPTVKRGRELGRDSAGPSMWDKFKEGAGDYFGDEENMANLAMAFNTMRLEPDQQLAAAMAAKAQSARKGKKSKLNIEAVIASLVKMGREDLAKYVADGSLDPKDAINAAIKKTKPSALQEKLQLMQEDPELFKKAQEAKLFGGATTNVNIGGDAYDKEAGKGFAVEDRKIVANAQAAPDIVQKAEEVKVLLNSDQINLGWLSNLKQGVDKVAASLGGKEALTSLSNTELFSALVGSDVFPMIKQLGIGARGLDTPAEREFLLAVMVGTATMTKETLLRMTQRRIDKAKQNIGLYNTYLSEGKLDTYQKNRKYKFQPISSSGVVQWSEM